jgi:hypothetical protein
MALIRYINYMIVSMYLAGVKENLNYGVESILGLIKKICVGS